MSLTKFRGDRVITVNGLFIGETRDRAWQEYHLVSRALAGAVDTDRLLRYSIGGLELQMYVRCEEVQAPIAADKPLVATQYVLRAPDPRAYSQTETVATITAATSGGGGLVMPFTFPITFGAIAGATVNVTNNGTVGSPGVITLTGYLLDPVVRLGSYAISFSGELAAGDELIIYLATRDVQLNGSPGAYFLDFSQTTWFDIPPGTSVVQLLAANYDASASIEVALNDAYE